MKQPAYNHLEHLAGRFTYGDVWTFFLYEFLFVNTDFSKNTLEDHAHSRGILSAFIYFCFLLWPWLHLKKEFSRKALGGCQEKTCKL